MSTFSIFRRRKVVVCVCVSCAPLFFSVRVLYSYIVVYNSREHFYGFLVLNHHHTYMYPSLVQVYIPFRTERTRTPNIHINSKACR